MILAFGDKTTADFYHGIQSRRVRVLPHQIIQTASDKLDVLNVAKSINELRSPPGNRLEALKGKFEGYYSIRINSQWRIIFRWDNSNCSDVQIIDYH